MERSDIGEVFEVIRNESDEVEVGSDKVCRVWRRLPEGGVRVEEARNMVPRQDWLIKKGCMKNMVKHVVGNGFVGNVV